MPILRNELVTKHPEVLSSLNALSGKITDQEMQQLNYEVDGQHRDAKEVVAEFRRKKGL